MSPQDNHSGRPASTPPVVLRVALPVPVAGHFDYLPVDGASGLPEPGVRLRVPFGRTERIGILVGIVQGASVSADRLRRVVEYLDDVPVIAPVLLDLLRWVSRYYHHPLGETLMTALPSMLRKGRSMVRSCPGWRLNERGRRADHRALLKRAPRQSMLYGLLATEPGGLDRETLAARMGASWRPALRALIDRGWVEGCTVDPRSRGGVEPSAGGERGASASPELNDEQARAVRGLEGGLGRFEASLVYGITGSGKTEVYFRLIESVLKAGRQALVLVPEIGLTPQLLDRFRRRFDVPIAAFHSGMSEAQRFEAWLRARDGEARIVVGTRSAVFAPLPKLGIVVVDEEHDASFKQQEGLRYHARDLAVMRARREGCPVLLGSASPSLESLQNAWSGRYRLHRLSRRFGAAVLPRIRLVDMKGQAMRDGLALSVIDAIDERLSAGQQVLIFLNRRGFATALVCHGCAWIAGCPRCDARLVLHRHEAVLRCHHCGHRQPRPERCPTCGHAELRGLGQGTERIEDSLRERFPGVGIRRVDRDTIRGSGRLDALLADVRDGRARILIGTQLLAKGHDFPDVTLVVVVDADQGLYGSDFRASERMGQLILQVSGRAGRAASPGEVLLQTYHPEHPLFVPLLAHDYTGYARALLDERRAAELPPFCHQALLRGEAHGADRAMAALATVATRAASLAGPAVAVLGPVPATMERRAGRHRAQLLFQSTDRQALHRLLETLLPWMRASKSMRRIRWSIDVDPIDFM